jgi:hypothetical protein
MNARTEHDPLEIVSAESLERELNLVRGAAAGSFGGVFGRDRSPGRSTVRPRFS